MTNPIPARIIQTGKSRELPLLARAAAANLKCLNPGFEWTFFDDRDVTEFVQREFPQHSEMFRNFRYRIQKYDFFRYLAVYRLGGFYFDLDVFLADGVDELRRNSCVFPFEELTLNQHLRNAHGMDWEVGNYAFAGAPGHPFLEAVIENCARAQRDPAWVEPMMRGIPGPFRADFEVLNTTGPGLVSRTLAENPGLAAEVTVLFPEDVCNPDMWHQFGRYGVHAMEGSWRDGGGFLRRRLALFWEARLRRRQLAESEKLGKSRMFPVARAGAEARRGATMVASALTERPAGTSPR